MKKITVEKHAKTWYVRVWHEDGTLSTQAGFTRKKDAEEVREHWITDKFFGEAEKG